MRPGSPLRVIADLMRLRAGPQDLPFSRPLLIRLAVAALAVNLVSTQLLDSSHGSALRSGMAFTVSLCLPWLVLSWRRRTERYMQTTSALLGTGIAFSLLLLPLASWALAGGLLNVENPVPDPQQALFAWLILGLVVWKVSVTAHIWRHALDWPLAGGVLVALGLFLIEFAIDRWFFATPAA